MANKISTVFEFSEKGSGLRKLRSDVQATEGSFNKMKVASKGAMSQIKQYGPEAALAVGGALATAAIKAGQEFADAAIAVGQFSDATGLSTEAASRWVSVADDLGLNADDVQKAFLRLNKEIGEGDGVVAEYGIELQRTATGAADVNATMLETIRVVNGIKDPTERARVAQELFGRSYANVAEIIFNDAEKVAAALESTSEAQTFDEEEVAKARRYREAMDRLNDVMTDLSMTVGESVVPALSDAANGLADLDQSVRKLSAGELQGVGDLFGRAVDQAVKGAPGFHDLGEAIFGAGESTRETSKWVTDLVNESILLTGELPTASEVIAAMGDAQGEAADSTERHVEAISKLFDEVNSNIAKMFDYEDATLELSNSAQDYAQQLADLAKLEANAKGNTDELARAKRDARLAETDLAREALATATAYAQSQGAIEGTTNFAILQRQELDRLAGQFPELRDEINMFIAELNRIPPVKTVSLQIDRATGSTRSSVIVDSSTGGLPRFDTGGVVQGPKGSPQLVVAHAGETILPTHKFPAAGMAGGVTIGSIVVQAPAGADADEFARKVREAIRREVRFNGPVSGWAA